MDEEAAETLMDQLPPSGWDQMATKDDVAGAELRLRSALTEATAGTDVKLADINARFVEINAKFVVPRGFLPL